MWSESCWHDSPHCTLLPLAFCPLLSLTYFALSLLFLYFFLFESSFTFYIPIFLLSMIRHIKVHFSFPFTIHPYLDRLLCRRIQLMYLMTSKSFLLSVLPYFFYSFFLFISRFFFYAAYFSCQYIILLFSSRDIFPPMFLLFSIFPFYFFLPS